MSQRTTAAYMGGKRRRKGKSWNESLSTRRRAFPIRQAYSVMTFFRLRRPPIDLHRVPTRGSDHSLSGLLFPSVLP